MFFVYHKGENIENQNPVKESTKLVKHGRSEVYILLDLAP
jgi:hypothetical protein